MPLKQMTCLLFHRERTSLLRCSVFNKPLYFIISWHVLNYRWQYPVRSVCLIKEMHKKVYSKASSTHWMLRKGWSSLLHFQGYFCLILLQNFIFSLWYMKCIHLQSFLQCILYDYVVISSISIFNSLCPQATVLIPFVSSSPKLSERMTSVLCLTSLLFLISW